MYNPSYRYSLRSRLRKEAAIGSLIKSGVKAVGGMMKSPGVMNAVKGAGQAISGVAGKVGGQVMNTAKNVGGKVMSTVGKVGGQVANVAKNVGGQVANAAKNINGNFMDATASMSNKFMDTAGKVSKNVGIGLGAGVATGIAAGAAINKYASANAMRKKALQPVQPQVGAMPKAASGCSGVLTAVLQKRAYGLGELAAIAGGIGLMGYGLAKERKQEN